MANKIKKISINALEKCVKESSGDPAVVCEWNGLDVVVKKRLGLVDMMTFVDGVVKTCFTEDGAKYTPEVRDFAIRCSILEMYTNFTLPSNIEKKYELVYGCDVFNTIFSVIDKNQFDIMIRAIDEKIEHIASANVDMAIRQVNDLYASLSSLAERFSSIFSGVEKDDIVKLVSAISDGAFDEGKLIQIYRDTEEHQAEADE